MSFLVCVVPVCPIRAEASHKSEQVSQLLFGELCEPQQWTKDFVKIKSLCDDYEGWCQLNQLEQVTHNNDITNKNQLAGNWSNTIKVNGQAMNIPFGSSVPISTKEEELIGKLRVQYSGAVINPLENSFSVDLIEKYTSIFINTPYQWGGRSVFGIDCSGFTQVVFSCMNIKLQRDAYQQATQGEAIGFLQEVKCGDLAFFDNESGRITHVGILLNPETIIHASGKVRVDMIDNFGILNKDTGKRTHNLRIIKRLVP